MKKEPSSEEDALSQILNRLSDLENTASIDTYGTGGDTFIEEIEEITIIIQNIIANYTIDIQLVVGDMGIQVNGAWARVDTTTNKSYGLDFDGTTAAAKLRVAAGDGIELVADYGVTVDLATDPGLELVGASSPDKELKAKVNTDAGLELDIDGIGINAGCGITFEDDALVLDYAPNAGLTCGVTGLRIDTRYGLVVDPVTDTNGKLDLFTGSVCYEKTPTAVDGADLLFPYGTGDGIAFTDEGATGNRMHLCPGDWLFIVEE